MVGTAFAATEGWTEDLEAAKKLAAESDRDVLINFTGSDWCGWCVKLKGEVFSQGAFMKSASKSFVLVELDYPRMKEIPEVLKQRNALLAKQYDIRRYPTIMLCDARGLPYAYTGYQKDGPEAYLEHLKKLQGHRQKRDEALTQALKLQGVDKARALIEVLDALPLHDALILGFYGSLIEVITASDPADETGFSKKMSSQKRLEEFKLKMMELGRNKDVDGAIAYVEATLKQDGFDAAARQEILMSRCMIHVQQKKFDEALKVSEEAIQALPDSPMSGDIRNFQQRLRQRLAAPKPPGGK